MPWKLIPPHTRPDGKKIEAYYIRGKYLGVALNHSTGTGEQDAAKRILATWRKRAERGELPVDPARSSTAATFVNAAIAYMQAGGSGQFLEPILRAWPSKMVVDIDQIALDTLATELYPKAAPATRSRQVYTPVAAVLHHVGIERKFKRPKGAAGNKSTSWLEPDQAFTLFAAADEVDPEFGLFCRFLCYTGERLGEALRATVGDLKLERSFLYLPNSKTKEPRGVYLPPHLVEAFRTQPPRRPNPFIRNERGQIISGQPVLDAGVPFLKRKRDRKLFRFHAGGRLREMLKKAMDCAGLSFPRRQRGFHIFCHTYGSWMHRYGELDRHGLTRTGRWTDPNSADRYVHTTESEEARRADRLPWSKRRQRVDVKAIHGKSA